MLLPNQVMAAGDDAAIQAQLAEMRAQMRAMQSRIDTLEDQLEAAQANTGAPVVVTSSNAAAQANADAPAVATPAIEAAPSSNAATPSAPSLASSTPATTAQLVDAKTGAPVKVSWKGAPQFESEDGFSFKLGGRLNVDAGFTSFPDSTGREDGFGSEVRRARLRVQGTVPGGFGYKLETDFAANDVTVTDAYLTYESKLGAGGNLEIIAGQHNTFQGLEELTSSLNTSFIERAAFTDAFGFERRLGLSGIYTNGDLLLQGGVFSDNIQALSNHNFSLDGRAVYAPKLGDVQLHFGGSLHYAKLAGVGSVTRYRQRPFEHWSSDRFVDTGAFLADSELGIGGEAAMIAGRFHVSGETYVQKVSRPGFADPTFFGGSLEAGYFLTKGDKRGYKAGTFDRVKPANPVGSGGIGAVQINGRYEYLDLTDAGIVGGTQAGYELSLIWTQTAYTRVMLNYARLQYKDAAYPTASGDTSYGVDVVAVRGQVDF